MIIIDGKATSEKIKEDLKSEILELKSKYKKEMGLAVIMASDSAASKVYVKNKLEATAFLGIKSFHYVFDENATDNDLINIINELNDNSECNGILVQLPLFPHLDEKKILNTISVEKDVDGFSAYQMGRLVLGSPGLASCTPLGIMELLKRYNIEISGKNAVVIGRSNIVGKPIAHMLLGGDATVTICHTKTKNLKEITKKADILVAAVGKAGLVTSDMVKKGAVVVDVGINRLPNGKLQGDVQFENVSKKAAFITPVPGGVGPMTITMLMSNTIKAYKMQNGK